MPALKLFKNHKISSGKSLALADAGELGES